MTHLEASHHKWDDYISLLLCHLGGHPKQHQHVVTVCHSHCKQVTQHISTCNFACSEVEKVSDPEEYSHFLKCMVITKMHQSEKLRHTAI